MGDPASREQPQIPGTSKHGPQGRAGGTKALQDSGVEGDRATVLSEGLKLQRRRSRSGTGKELPHSYVLLVTMSFCQSSLFKSYKHLRYLQIKLISVGQLHL